MTIGIILWVVLLIGWLVYGTPFLQTVWNAFAHGIPGVWSRVIGDRYAQMCGTGILAGLGLPLLGLVLAVLVAQFDTEYAQIIVFITFPLGALIIGAAAWLMNLFVKAVIYVLPVGSSVRQDLDDTRLGVYKTVEQALSFVLFTGLSFVLLGVLANPSIAAIVMLAVAVYYQVSIAYDVPIVWSHKFMMGTSLTVAIVLAILTGLSVFPLTREYVDDIGLDPLHFMSAGMVNTGTLDTTIRVSRAKRAELCDAKMGAIEARIKAIRVTIADPSDPLKTIVNPAAEIEFERETKVLTQERRKCYIRHHRV